MINYLFNLEPGQEDDMVIAFRNKLDAKKNKLNNLNSNSSLTTTPLTTSTTSTSTTPATIENEENKIMKNYTVQCTRCGERYLQNIYELF